MRQPKASRAKLLLLSRLLVAAAVIILVVGAIVTWQQYQSNQQADQAAARQQQQANHGHASGNNPSTTRPGLSELENYQVPAVLPRYLFIPKIGVTARVQSVGLTKAGAIGSPSNVYDTAWYNGSAKPGAQGAMLIDGHISSWTTHGVFYDLKNLRAGDQIKIERGDGDTFVYTVVKTQTYAADKINMDKLLAPIDPAKPGLNLISCAGDVIAGTNQFDQRIVVYAKLAS